MLLCLPRRAAITWGSLPHDHDRSFGFDSQAGSMRNDLIEFVRNERGGIDRATLSVELAMLGKTAPQLWSVASAEDWSCEIDAAIKNGDLVVVDRLIQIPKEATQVTVSQLSLF